MINTPTNTDPRKVKEISQKLCSFLRENILAPDVEVHPETELHAIGIDSFALMELVLFIERCYGLVLPPESLTPENIATVNALSACCARQLQIPDN